MFIPYEFGALLIPWNSASVQTELLLSQEKWCFDLQLQIVWILNATAEFIKYLEKRLFSKLVFTIMFITYILSLSSTKFFAHCNKLFIIFPWFFIDVIF
jgi:hypothetical protein